MIRLPTLVLLILLLGCSTSATDETTSVPAGSEPVVTQTASVPENTQSPTVPDSDDSQSTDDLAYEVPEVGELTLTEQTRLILDCMQLNGVAAELDLDIPNQPGIIVESSTPEEGDEAAEVYLFCSERLREEGIVPPEDAVTPEALAELYGEFLQLAECVRGLGYPVNEPPSMEVFIDQAGGWHPYDRVAPELDQSSFNQLLAECPQP